MYKDYTIIRNKSQPIDYIYASIYAQILPSINPLRHSGIPITIYNLPQNSGDFLQW